MNIAKYLEYNSSMNPDRPALIFRMQILRYRELNEAAGRVANTLKNLGIGRGDRVALFYPNCLDFAAAYFGVQKLGAICVSMSAHSAAEDAAYMLSDSGAVVILTHRHLMEKIENTIADMLSHRLVTEYQSHVLKLFDVTKGNELSENASPHFDAVDMAATEPSAILYTSGTSGQSKGVTLSHGNVISNVRAKIKYTGITPNDRLMMFVPITHSFGQNAVFNAGLMAGAVVVLHERFDPCQIRRSLSEDGITMYFGPPASYAPLIADVPYQEIAGVRYFFAAASSLPEDIEKKWAEKYGRYIFQGYGLTETSPFACYNHFSDYRYGSVGTPIEHVRMKVINTDDGSDMPPGKTGEILIQGPNVMLGYWNKPEQTAHILKNGWLHTGDIGKYDDDGYFYIVDRLKDMVNVGGNKVWPAEVEKEIACHPAVGETAAYGVPDRLFGEQLMADIVLRDGHQVTEKEILDFCRNRCDPLKVPRFVRFVESLPKSATGKVLKRVLKQAASENKQEYLEIRTQESTTHRSKSDIREWICNWITDETGIERPYIDARKSFADYGIDSLGAVKLADELGGWLGKNVEPITAWKYASPERLSVHLSEVLLSENSGFTASETGKDAPAFLMEDDDKKEHNTDHYSRRDIADLLADEIKYFPA